MKNILIFVALIFLSSNVFAFKWYRGNTHAHTILSGHGDATAEEVTNWYHRNGYNFLVLSEHNKFINPKKVQMPKPLRNDFILIPGVEVSGNHVVHTTAFNVTEVIPWKIKSEKARDVLKFHVDGVLKAKGTPIANHPNFAYALNADDLHSIKKLSFLELYNAHPLVNNHGDQEHPSVEEIWDNLLTRGKKIYALASDDAHYFHTDDPKKSIPGFGWIMVKSNKLTPKAVVEALDRGNFYASSGVTLRNIERNINGKYSISVNVEETVRILKLKESFKVKIELIGEKGKTLETFNGLNKSFFIKDYQSKYLRARVLVETKNKVYSAWTMPYYNH